MMGGSGRWVVLAAALGACAGAMTSGGGGGFRGPHKRFESRPLDAECLKQAGGKAPALALPEGGGLGARTCADGADVVVAQAGARVAGADEILAFKAAHEKSWMAFPGLHGVGFGVCCGDATDAGDAAAAGGCLRVYLHLCTTPLDQVVEAVFRNARAGGLADASFAVLFDVDGASGPRCDSSDPDCQPIPYSGARYRDGAPRHPVRDDLGLSGGACAGDGECVEAGCGNHCVPWNEPGFAAICPAYGALESALCGCVAGSCTWFTQ